MKNWLSNAYVPFKEISLVIICFFCAMTSSLNAQLEGKIDYIETIKIDIQIDGMDESMMALIPKSQSINKELLFNGKESLYRNQTGEVLEDTELESDDGSFKIMIMHDDTEELFYCDNSEKQQTRQRGIMGKSFVVESPMVKNKWKITSEKIKYLGYECSKAVIETDEQFIVAWFTSELPLQIGPANHYGLPGAVLMVNVDDGQLEIKATKVNLDPLEKNAIKKPNDGKKVTEEEFEKIREEKEKELQQSYQNNTRH